MAAHSLPRSCEQQAVLCRTPQALLKTVEGGVLNSWEGAMQGDKTMREVGSLMDPRVIERMRQIQDFIYASFL